MWYLICCFMASAEWPLPLLLSCCCRRFHEAPSTYPPPPSDIPTGLKQHYWLDLASLLPPLLLGVQPHHVVLDMCAAPGGKSLVLAHCLLHPAGRASALQQAPARFLQDQHVNPLVEQGRGTGKCLTC
jgi:hypothetical protein